MIFFFKKRKKKKKKKKEKKKERTKEKRKEKDIYINIYIQKEKKEERKKPQTPRKKSTIENFNYICKSYARCMVINLTNTDKKIGVQKKLLWQLVTN